MPDEQNPEGENGSDSMRFKSYRDIPGVTEEDVKAVENLKAKKEFLVYGAPFSTEAFLGHDGEIHGFAALFSAYLTELFGIEVKPRLMSWDELIAGMTNDTVDLVGELSKSPEREKFLFMTAPIAERAIKYMRIKDSMPLYELVRKKSGPLRYGFMFDSTTVDLMKNNAPETFIAIEVQSEDEAYVLLRDGSIDAYITEATAEAAFDKFTDVETFDYVPILYADVSLSSKNPEIVPIINVFGKALEAGIQKYLVELYNDGIDEYRQNKFYLRLTPEELAYLDAKVKANEPVVYAAEHDNYPLSFYNDVEEAFQGVSLDVIAEISKITGLTFKLWNEEPVQWTKVLEALENGEFSMVTELIMFDARKGHYIWSETGYSSDKFALISKTETPDKQINEVLYSRVGIVEGTGWTDTFFKWFRNHTNYVTFPTSKVAFEALSEGEIELLMGTRNLNLSMTSFMEQPIFKVNLTFNYTFDSLFGFNKKETILCSIVSKAVTLTDTESITERWLQKTFDYRGKLARSRVPVLFGFSLMLFLLLVLTVLLMRRYVGDKARLAKIVSERTAELSAKTDEATRASRAKGDFLARMSHEIRTPMNAIIGMAELALREDPPEETAEMIGNIQSAGASLLSIINDILDFSKIESGKMEIIKADYHLSSLIQDTISVISARVMGANLELLIEVDANLPALLHGDEVRVRQILLNLLSNAVKYTKEGTVTLRVEGHFPEGAPTPEPAQVSGPQEITIKISVIDTGIGIKPEDMGKLFGSFSQVDTEKNKGIEGTGLGLAISKNLAILMGGDIAVQSEYQKGSVFSVTLKQQVQGPYVPMANLKDAKKSKTIFLDPSPADGQAFAFAMKSLGAEYLHVTDTQELKDAIKTRGFDFLIAPFGDADPILAMLKELGSPIKPAFILNFGAKGGKKKGLHVIQKPIYCLPVANVLNDAEETKTAKSRKDRVGLIAPDAQALVVDDILINLKVAKGLLSPFKLRVDTAVSGQEAINLVKANHYDIIFMDHMMPGMDGIETTERIRDLPGGKDIPIIALTANAITGVKEMFISHGMNDFISKPIEHGKLEAMLAEWLPKDKLKSPPPKPAKPAPHGAPSPPADANVPN
ncbi:MAG: transporter substrate-binding domain-containing protein [Deltaproteobacteria bacterium]|nr:transporter substrate-binding domain-containing protein [Deltaproteobacteria bacterium]